MFLRLKRFGLAHGVVWAPYLVKATHDQIETPSISGVFI
jgi:hypothetical protein